MKRNKKDNKGNTCNIENNKISYFLGTLSKDRLLKIAKNYAIPNYLKLSKKELIMLISEQIPKEYPPDIFSKSKLAKFLMYLPEEMKNFISEVYIESSPNCDFGVWKQDDLLSKYGKKATLWIRKLSNYALIFKVKYEKETYIVVPRDINFVIGNLISGLVPPKEIHFDKFLQNMNKSKLQEFCRIYGIKVSGTKIEIIHNIIASGLIPEDILSVMYHENLVELAENLNIFPWGEVNPKKIDRGELIKQISKHILYETKNTKFKAMENSYGDVFAMTYYLISTKFTPIMKWDSTEADIEKQLIAYLRGFFDGKNIDTNWVSQYTLSSGGKIDIYEPKNDVGIELKYNPSRAYLREAVQRIKEYKEDVGEIIVAIFYSELYYNHPEYVRKYKKILEGVKNVKVIVRTVM